MEDLDSIIAEEKTKIEGSYPNVNIEIEKLTEIVQLRLAKEYRLKEQQRFYKRGNYEKEEEMGKLVSQISEDISKKSNTLYDNLRIANSITPENFDVNMFETLRANNFRGGFKNPLIDTSYRMYCESKEKDGRIAELEGNVSDLEKHIAKQDRIISNDDKAIESLVQENEELQRTVSGSQKTIASICQDWRSIDSQMQTLDDSIQKEKKKSFFTILGERIKGFFSKAPRLPAIDDSCKDVRQSVTHCWDESLKKNSKLGEEIRGHEKKSISIKNMLKRREKMKGSNYDIAQDMENDREEIGE